MLRRADLLAIVDANASVAEEIGERYNVDWYTDPDTILQRSDVEAVSICTPTVTHANIALNAIKKSKHVLIEKPMTNTVNEAKSLIQAADAQNVFLAVGFVERFNPAVNETIRRVAEREIGDIILAHARRVSKRPPRIGDVGVIKDLAIHDIDIVNQLFKSQAEEVFAAAGNIAHQFEDYANIIIKFGANRNAFIEANWLTPRKVRRLIVTGTKGLINVEYIPQEMRVETNEGSYQPFIDNIEPLQLELEGFVNSILNDEQPHPTGLDGLRALRICEAALRSAKTGQVVSVRGE